MQKESKNLYDLTSMCFVRASICNAMSEGLTIEDLFACAENAKTPEKFDEAVNILVRLKNG